MRRTGGIVALVGLMGLAGLFAAESGTVSVEKETPELQEARIAWWREVKFGALVSFNPSSITGGEIGWSRKGTKPLDISGNPAGFVEDPVYDNLYKQFNPEKFDADVFVSLLKKAGMRYLVYNAKHHDGFSMFHTRMSDYSIANTPFKRDVTRELADACRKAGLRFGIYYSQRDWHHPDYGQGDNRKYLEFMNGQLRELLTNYGNVDVIWFDSYGKGDLVDFWRIGETWSVIKSLQPKAVVNNRLAILGRYNAQPEPYRGDFDTPEQRIGRFQRGRAWESCMTLTEGWSHRDGKAGLPRSHEELMRALCRCVTGDGNLMLGFGPDETGVMPAVEVEALEKMGEWLNKYGDSVYGTRGGPYAGGNWGGSTYRGNKVFLHIIEWSGAETLKLGPLDGKVSAIRALAGGEAGFKQSETGLDVTLSAKNRQPVVTVLELTLERTLQATVEK